jgi:SNF2 family DNA or RNA helicase
MLINKHRLPAFTPRHPPFAHQQEALDISKDKTAFALLMEMGLGKSKVTIDNFIYLFMQQEIDGVFIVAPKGAYLNWLTDELPAHMPEWLHYRVAYWDANWTQTQRRAAEEVCKPYDDCLDIFLMNIEALVTDRAVEFAERFIKMHYTFCVVDESTCIKNHKAKRTKAITRLGWWCDYRRILSGSPITKGPLDIFAQAEFLEEGLSGFKNFQAFKNYYAVTRKITLGNRSFEKIEKYINIPELQERIARFSYRRRKEECIDLPEKIFTTRYIQHTEEQETYYSKLKEEALIEFSDESMVSSKSVLTTIMKLHQINCGHIKDDFGNVIDVPHGRLEALIQVLEETDDKTIIWCNFVEDVRRVTAALAEEYGDDSVVHYYGSTTTDERLLHRERFNRDPTCKYFVANRTGSKALTLVQANTAVYYSYDYDLETWLQSQDRNHRIGQTRTCNYIILAIPNTVDTAIIKALTAKEDLAEMVLDRWRTIL